ncbi:MAG: glycerate-2-kinase family protein [Planctomycetia bacterium]
MTRASLRGDAESLWTAALRAVQPEHLVAERLVLAADGSLRRMPHDAESAGIRIDAAGKIVVVGGGKAAAGLAAGFEKLLGPDRLGRHRVSGLVSVPQGSGRRLERIEVRETRPAESNLPTQAVVQATHEMLDRVSRMERRDLAVAVITGGGSALLAAPRAGVTLEEKIAVTRRLSRSGADIASLNAVRRTMSVVKAGGLARACTAGDLLVLVLSDVIGDDLDVIASGPCMPQEATVPPGCWTTPSGCRVHHLLVGHNQTAVTAASRSPTSSARASGPPGAATTS